MMAAGCAGLRGERWEVEAREGLSRGALSVQAASEGEELSVLLTSAPPPGEEAHVTDIFLVSAKVGRPVGEGREKLPPDEVEPVGGPRGPIGIGFLYSTGDTERYVSRYSDKGYASPASPPGPQHLRATWRLAGPRAQARQLELVVVVALSPYPKGELRIEEAHFIITRPHPQSESPLPTPSPLGRGAG